MIAHGEYLFQCLSWWVVANVESRERHSFGRGRSRCTWLTRGLRRPAIVLYLPPDPELSLGACTILQPYYRPKRSNVNCTEPCMKYLTLSNRHRRSNGGHSSVASYPGAYGRNSSVDANRKRHETTDGGKSL